MEPDISRRLTAKESSIIAEIESKAKKRKHKPKYTPDFIVDYMLESYKDWDYDCKEDALDMLDAIFEVARKCKIMTSKQITKERKYMMKEYVNGWYNNEN